jgi:16S rRNA (guanine527-N7)-methyltransferase
MDNDDKINFIKNAFLKNNIQLSSQQCDQFLLYYELLVDWNTRVNLTAITEFEDIVFKHFIDSTALLTLKDVSRETINGQLIDVGTGAGFPGIPLKIVVPSLKLTLLDALSKRITFLQCVCDNLKLKDVKLVHMRAEDAASDPMFREKYDVCVARAVANMATLTEYCLPFIHKSGYFLAYKSGEIDEEVNEAKKCIKVMGGEIKQIEKFTLSGSDIARSVVMIRKVENTPKKYPRKAGTPGKHPIK